MVPANRIAPIKRDNSDRFLAFVAPTMLLVYYVVFTVIAGVTSETPTASADISPIEFVEEIIDPDGSAPADPHVKTVGDINGDGLPDVIVGGAGDSRNGGTNNTNNGLFWYVNPSWDKKTIVPHDSSSGGFSTDMQVGDVDGDGDLDIVVPGPTPKVQSERTSNGLRTLVPWVILQQILGQNTTSVLPTLTTLSLPT